MGFKKFCFVVNCLVITGFYTVSFFSPQYINISIYGLYLVLYSIVQAVTSKWNDDQMKSISYEKKEKIVPPDSCNEDEGFHSIPLETPSPQKRVVLLVVGHRENPLYWEQCLLSVCRLNLENLRKVYILIDGNTGQDVPMFRSADALFKKEKPDGFPPIELFMVQQRGKRGMLFTGIEKVRFDFYNEIDSLLVAVTDSDTQLDPQSLVQLERCMDADASNGCATGILKIFNLPDGILPRIINARYHYAFAMERASLSYFGCMTCCSGPLSIYRLAALNPLVMKKFNTQTIWGVKCEPGDDRHLTNLVMAQGYKSRQTSYAIAATEAPETYIRFLLQQLRWSRSFFREFKWQWNCLDQQSFFLGFYSVYETLFPWFVVVWVSVLFYTLHPAHVYIKAVVVSCAILLIRTMILFVRFRQANVFYNILYYPLYFTLLLPTKIFAGVTFLNNTWVTQSRDTQKITCSIDAYFYFGFLLVWQLYLVCGILYTLNSIFHFLDQKIF